MCSGGPTRHTTKKRAIVAAVARTLAAGGEVWSADETTLREFPPLRAGWARRGEQAVAAISGRNARRGGHGGLNIAAGEGGRGVRERERGAGSAGLIAALAGRAPPGAGLPGGPRAA